MSDEQMPREPSRRPSMRPRTVRPAGAAPDSGKTGDRADRVTTMVHELSGLLDSTLRCLDVARKSVSDPARRAPEREALERRLDAVNAAVEQMATLVRTYMGCGGFGGVRAISRSVLLQGSLRETIEHAAEVMRPEAEEAGARIVVDAPPELDAVEDGVAGGMYAVVVNALRNAIESVLTKTRGRGGGGAAAKPALHESEIVVRARVGRCERLGGALGVTIEVVDGGAGLCRELRIDPDNAMRHGYTTKEGGSGVGLALAASIVDELGGVMDLSQRTDGERGAVLRVAYPLEEDPEGDE